jgi:hypothetical protein
MTRFPDPAAWRAACAEDAVLAAWRGPWRIEFAIEADGATVGFAFAEAGPATPTGCPTFTFAAPSLVRAKFLAPVPPRHHHAIFAMLARVPELAVRGDQLAFMQHCHVARRVLDIGRWLALGNALPVPTVLNPRGNLPTAVPAVSGGYVPVTARGSTHHVYFETAGSGRDLLCLHTAGADGRQFHRLMVDPRLTRTHRLVAFDLPWHGKSSSANLSHSLVI